MSNEFAEKYIQYIYVHWRLLFFYVELVRIVSSNQATSTELSYEKEKGMVALMSTMSVIYINLLLSQV